MEPSFQVGKPQRPGARRSGLPRSARGGRCRDSNRHDRSCSWLSSPHLFSVYRALAGCERRVPRRAAAVPAGAICPVRTALVVRTVGREILKDRELFPGRCRGSHHIAAMG